MQLFNKETRIDFLRLRKAAYVLSVALFVGSFVALFMRGLNFGIDFTGGTLVEVGYSQSVEVDAVRKQLADAGIEDAIIQHFGTAKDVAIRLPSSSQSSTSAQSESIMEALRAAKGESISASADGASGVQQCARGAEISACTVQMRRVEFVGPQVGDELTNQGGLAMLYALMGILIYVTLRFRWQFSIGAVIALVHDVVLTVGAFALFQFEFSLSVLAAVLAVIGYSLNDTIVVYDRIRENFRKMRKGTREDIINAAINQTLPRTLLTSLTTLFVVMTLLLFGGEVIHGFSIALLLGVCIGTYSSIFVASPALLFLGVQREQMMPKVDNDEDVMKAVV